MGFIPCQQDSNRQKAREYLVKTCSQRRTLERQGIPPKIAGGLGLRRKTQNAITGGEIISFGGAAALPKG
jgi:hypothetical protein